MAPTLARAGWTQVCTLARSAPHDSRFKRVPGGWQPLTRDGSPSQVPWVWKKPTERGGKVATDGSSAGSVVLDGATTSSVEVGNHHNAGAPCRRLRRKPRPLPYREWVSRVRNGYQPPELRQEPEAGSGAEAPMQGSEGPPAACETKAEQPLTTAHGSFVAFYGERRRLGQLGLPGLNGRRMSGVSSPSLVSSSDSSSDADSAPFYQKGLPEVMAEVRASLPEFEGAARPRSVREGREEVYAHLLLAAQDVRLNAGHLGMSDKETLQEMALLFARCDTDLDGFILPHEALTILRCLGREVPGRRLYEMLELVCEEKYGVMRNDPLDFMDVIQVVGMQARKEQALLKRTYERLHTSAPDGRSLSGLELREVARALEVVGLRPRLEHIKQVSAELRLTGRDEGRVRVRQAADLCAIAEQCRKLEKQRAFSHAGFSHDQVCLFHDTFERLAGTASGELSRSQFLELLVAVQAMPQFPQELQDLDEFLDNVDDSGNVLFCFEECLHLLRRFYDKEDYVVELRENQAADEAGLCRQDVHDLRGTYSSLIQKDHKLEFSYFALTKAIRLLLGVSITVEQNKVLHGLFRQHAVASKAAAEATPRRDVEGLHLPFVGFVRIMGRLWRDDVFATDSKPKGRLSMRRQRTVWRLSSVLRAAHRTHAEP